MDTITIKPKKYFIQFIEESPYPPLMYNEWLKLHLIPPQTKIIGRFEIFTRREDFPATEMRVCLDDNELSWKFLNKYDFVSLTEKEHSIFYEEYLEINAERLDSLKEDYDLNRKEVEKTLLAHNKNKTNKKLQEKFLDAQLEFGKISRRVKDQLGNV